MVPLPNPIPEDDIELFDKVLEAITPSLPLDIHKYFRILTSPIRLTVLTENKYEVTCDDMWDFLEKYYNIDDPRFIEYEKENTYKFLKVPPGNFVFSKIPNYDTLYRPLLESLYPSNGEDTDKSSTSEAKSSMEPNGTAESEMSSEDSSSGSDSSTPVRLPTARKVKHHSVPLTENTPHLIKSAVEKSDSSDSTPHVGRRSERFDSQKEARPISARGRAPDKNGNPPRVIYAVHSGTATSSRRGRGRPHRTTPYPQRNTPGKPGKKPKNLRSVN